jgi:hypothetical protein
MLQVVSWPKILVIFDNVTLPNACRVLENVVELKNNAELENVAGPDETKPPFAYNLPKTVRSFEKVLASRTPRDPAMFTSSPKSTSPFMDNITCVGLKGSASNETGPVITVLEGVISRLVISPFDSIILSLMVRLAFEF